MTPPPAGLARLLPGEALDLDRPLDRARILAAALEDGDRDDLAGLAARLTRDEIGRWFDRHGRRRLSRRSRAFWAAVLGRPFEPAAPIAEALWPLA
jgi:hypothetical protein